MRKQTKVVAVASAAALLAIGASMTSFAATGWVEEDGQWYFYDKDGNRVEDEWKRSGDNLSKKTIGGKVYAFDDEGVMLYGWVDKTGEMQNDDTGWQSEDAVYYFGGWEDGSMKTGWQRISVYDDAAGKDDDYDYWFNFKSNGQKRTDTNKKKINSKYYAFDERGVMIYEWFQPDASASNASPSSWNYFSSPEDGARVYKGWFKIAPPTEDNSFLEDDATFATDDSENESERWYYSDDEGLVSGKIKKIKGKYYGFHPEGAKGGRMLTGLCALEMDGENIVKVLYDGMDSDDLDEFMDSSIASDSQKNTSTYLYYFGDDADTDGAMKTGSVSINLDGSNYNFYFDKSGGAESKGRGINGIDDNDYIYRYGQKLKASSDDKFILVYATDDTGSDDAVVIDYSGGDVRKAAKGEATLTGLDNLSYDDTSYKNGDKNTIRLVSGFDKNNLKQVNSAGKIQDGGLTAKKDGDDWYWYATKERGLVMYTSEKDLKGCPELEGSNWKDYDFK